MTRHRGIPHQPYAQLTQRRKTAWISSASSGADASALPEQDEPCPRQHPLLSGGQPAAEVSSQQFTDHLSDLDQISRCELRLVRLVALRPQLFRTATGYGPLHSRPQSSRSSIHTELSSSMPAAGRLVMPIRIPGEPAAAAPRAPHPICPRKRELKSSSCLNPAPG